MHMEFEVLWSLLLEIVVYFITPIYQSFTKIIIVSFTVIRKGKIV